MLSARKMQLSCGNVLSIVTEAKSLITPESNAAQCGVQGTPQNQRAEGTLQNNNHPHLPLSIV